MVFPIHTQRLHIRDLKEEDVDDFLVYRSNPAVTQYQGFDIMDRAQAFAFIQSNAQKPFDQPDEWKQFAIVENNTQRLIGDCALHFFGHENKIAEIGMTISHLHQQKGYAKEAMQVLIHFLFEQKNVLRIHETTDAENIAAMELLKSLGFTQEGYFKENTYFKGKWGSECQFALLYKEWKNSRS